jgi:Ran GTPase-activating protein (RanGAP) involved in mRNA processing and transport
MAAAAVANPVSVPTTIGTREVIDVAAPKLNWQKLENPQVSIQNCSLKYGPQAIRSLFEKLADQGLESTYEEINLSDNKIEDEGAKYLEQGLGANKSLKTLLMPRAGVGAEGVTAIGRLIGECTAIETAILSSNICDAEGVTGDFCKGITKNKSLRSLCLAAMRLRSEGANQIFQGPLMVHPKLEHLSLTYNRLTASCVESLNKALAKNKALRYLDLCGNDLGPEGAVKLVEGLKANSNRLQKLGLAQNLIRLKGTKALAEHFISKDGKSLDYCDLRHNQTTFRGNEELRKILGKEPLEEAKEGWLMLFDDSQRQLLINAF